ncbi:uncharacterized protein LOC108455538 [Gossypium arboreum]|uniref:uncharacterized protein LOC108455538 n=1 Tax=Gossypium arboreum TaxID=29729 RepID=UPI0008195997|nr:uncharacterized protein LOC108455538 [Gossypium arboreum]
MAGHGFIGGCLHTHERRPVLGETGPFRSFTERVRNRGLHDLQYHKERRDPSALFLSVTANGQTPRGSATYGWARAYRSTPRTINQRCQMALRGAWNGHDRGVVAEGRPTVRQQQHAWGKGCCCFLYFGP